MCRFTFYLGKPLFLSSLITDPTHSLIHQSFHSHEREEPLNGDGFGVAWYVVPHEEPALFRSITPAWSNANLRDLARVTSSSCVLTHVRAATQQLEVNEANCHPFKKGAIAFMHNGDIGGFGRIRRPLVQLLSDDSFYSIRGTTDSEHFFALFQDYLKEFETPLTEEKFASALEKTIQKVLELRARYAPSEQIYLNLVIADGSQGVACRFTTDVPEHADSLYLSTGKRYICEEGFCRMLLSEEHQGAVLISSEPLSDDPSWEMIPVNHLVKIHKNRTATLQPIRIP